MPHHQAVSSTFEFLHNYCCKFLNGAYKGGGVYVLKSSSPSCCGFFCNCFLCLCLGLLILYQGVGKFVRLCAFELHHRVSTSSCDDVQYICAYCSIKNFG